MLDVRFPISDIQYLTVMPPILLAYYCALILVASIMGGMIPVWFQLTHRWMQFAVSFVAGVMLGIGVSHMLPPAIADASSPANTLASERAGAVSPSAPPAAPILNALNADAVHSVVVWMLVGMLAMFFIE